MRDRVRVWTAIHFQKNETGPCQNLLKLALGGVYFILIRVKLAETCTTKE